jgi:uncharacterized membrane protein
MYSGSVDIRVLIAPRIITAAYKCEHLLHLCFGSFFFSFLFANFEAVWAFSPLHFASRAALT